MDNAFVYTGTGESAGGSTNPYENCTTSGDILTDTTTYPGCNTPDIIVCSGSGTGYTIAACNIGATTAGITSTSYGRFFQWGEDVAWDNNTGTTSANNCTWDRDSQSCTSISTSLGWPTLFGVPSISDIQSGGIDRWHAWGDTRGPCAIGYKIPSQTQWQDIIIAGGWESGFGSPGPTDMQNTLLLPWSGSRSSADGSRHTSPASGIFWSSTPNSLNAVYLITGDHNIFPNGVSSRANGFSVRCFKN